MTAIAPRLALAALATLFRAPLLALIAAVSIGSARAAPGQLDPTFGNAGIVRTNLGSGADTGNALAMQADGKIVVAGYSENGGKFDFALARFNTDGTLDTSFNGTGKVTTAFGTYDDRAQALAIDAKGRIVVAGSIFSSDPATFGYCFAVARYNSDGTLDTSFNGTGKVFNVIGGADYASAIAIDASGRIVVAGRTTSDGTSFDFALARYNTNGTLDGTFNGVGTVITNMGTSYDIANAVAIDATGRIVVAGAANNAFAVARYNTNGTLDTTFNATGKVITATGTGPGEATAIAIDAGGRIVVAGSSLNGASNDFALVRYNANGTLDTGFNGTGKVTTAIGTSTDAAQAIAIDSGGRIVVAGYSISGSNGNFALARYLDSGALDTSLAGTGRLVVAAAAPGDSYATGVAIDVLGRIVLAGLGGTNGGDFAVARVLPSGGLDTSFGQGGIATASPSPSGSTIWNAMARQADGSIVVAGTAISEGKSNVALARFNANGASDTSFNGTGKVTTAIGTGNDAAYAIAIDAGGRIVVAGTSNGDFALARYNENGALDTSFNGTGKVTTAIGTGDDEAFAIAIDAGGRIVVAGQSQNGSSREIALARYNKDGTLDTAFNGTGKVTTAIGSSTDVATALAIDARGRIVVTGYSDNGKKADFAVVRYNANGSLDTTFGGTGKVTTAIGISTDNAQALAIDAGGRIVVAGFSSNGSNNDFALARYNSNGTLDASFNGTGMVTTAIGSLDDYAWALAIDASGRIVAAGQSSNGSDVDVALARYNDDGSLDTSFNGTGKASTAIGTGDDFAYAILLHEGKALLAGYATSPSIFVTDANDGVIARFLMEQSPAAFAFTPQAGVALSTVVTSNAITVQGITGSVPITVVNGEYALGCTPPYTSAPGLVSNGAQVCVRHVSAAQPLSPQSTTLVVGTTSATFASSTGKAASLTSLAVSGNPSNAGVAVSFTATVSGAFGPPSGTLAFLDGAIELGTAVLDGSGQAVFTTSSLATGAHSITASYGGNATYDTSVSSVLVQSVSGNSLPRLANISTRMQVLTGNDVLIGGFIIGGSATKTVVVRARGPSLIPLGVPNALANPVLQVFSGATQIAANDNWETDGNAATLNASGYAPGNPLESALYMTLGPGAYTAIVTGAGLTTGVGIIEVFEVDHPEIPLVNIATRGQVLTGGDVMIGGFIIQGDGPQTVVVRARGPSLTAAGVPNALANPVLQLFSGQTVIASNDDWGTAGNAATLSASGFAPANALESAILITLPPGAYTAIVTGAGGSTGVAIIEVFAQ